MFVYSVRGSTVRFFAVVALTLLVLFGVLVFGTDGVLAASADTDISFGGIKTNEDRIAFIASCGVSVEGEPIETAEFSVPESFVIALIRYNEIQRAQGLDLAKYKNKRVTRYTYEAKDYGDYSGRVTVNLIIYRRTVVACDVSAIGADGFVKPLVQAE